MSTSKFSLSLGAARTQSSNKNTAPKRPHALLADEDDDVEETHAQNTITEYGGPPKAIDSQAKPARVIQSLPNRDWQADLSRKRQKSGLPSHYQPETTANAAADVVVASKTYGLTFRTQSQSPQPEDPRDEEVVRRVEHPRTVDDEALDALTGKERTQQTIIRPDGPQNEDQAFRAQYSEAPDVASLEDYISTPVEGFGAAILRGYLAPGETLESRIENGRGNDKKIERRPGLLGIGAKDSGLGIELGAWGGNKNGRKGKEDINYNPLARRNVKTGEMLTEEGLKKKLDQQRLVKEGSRDSTPTSNGTKENGRRFNVEDDGPSQKSSRSDRLLEYQGGEDKPNRRREEARSREYDSSSRRERSKSRERRYRHEGTKHASRHEDRNGQRRRKDADFQDKDRRRREHRRRDRSR